MINKKICITGLAITLLVGCGEQQTRFNKASLETEPLVQQLQPTAAAMTYAQTLNSAGQMVSLFVSKVVAIPLRQLI